MLDKTVKKSVEHSQQTQSQSGFVGILKFVEHENAVKPSCTAGLRVFYGYKARQKWSEKCRA